MKADVEVAAGSPGDVRGLALKAEEYGFDCFWVNETKHDPFVQLALASTSTSKIGLGTSIALAFTRSPTTLAYAAWDLQSVSGGRLILGLGSQVKGHVERRFGMKWESPAPKMKETVEALRAVWRVWQEGGKLDFQGRFYKLDLMTPFFSPGPIGQPQIPVYIAGVNQGMWKVAGAVAQGVHLHPLHTVRYLREVLEPALGAGLARANRSRNDVSVAASVFAAVGEGKEEMKKMRESCREQIAFYASTRTYRTLMELHGWGDVSERLHELSVNGEWGKMAAEVPDDAVEEFVVEGTWEELPALLLERYGRMVDRVRLYRPFDGVEGWKMFAEGLREER